MIGASVLTPQNAEPQSSETPLLQRGPETGPALDPLSDVLALMKPQTYVAGGFALLGDAAICFPKHRGIKCYAMLAGQCWLVVEGMPEPMLLQVGDCFLLPRGLPFQLSTDLSLKPVLYTDACARLGMRREPPGATEGARYIAGGHFTLTGSHTEMLLQSLPPVVHIRREQDRATMRWSLERMREELSNPQPGGLLIAQQLAYMMLIQALRLHLTDAAHSAPGWLSALADPHMSRAIASMHQAPGDAWTLESLAKRVGMSRSVFALRFRQTVGIAPMEYLTRWRMLLAAEQLKSSSGDLSTTAQSLGYQSASAFGKAFRRVMGCSPRQYTRPSSTVQQGADIHRR